MQCVFFRACRGHCSRLGSLLEFDVGRATPSYDVDAAASVHVYDVFSTTVTSLSIDNTKVSLFSRIGEITVTGSLLSHIDDDLCFSSLRFPAMTRAISPLATVVACTIKSTSRGLKTAILPSSVVILCFTLCAQFTSPICVGVGSFPSDLSCRTSKGIGCLVVTCRMTNLVTWTHATQEEGFAPSSRSRFHLRHLRSMLLSRRHSPATPSVQLRLNIIWSSAHPEQKVLRPSWLRCILYDRVVSAQA